MGYLTIKKENLQLTLYSAAVFFSFFYMPLEISGTAITTKVMPLLLLAIATLMGASIGLLQSKWFYGFLLTIFLPLWGAIHSPVALVYYLNFLFLSFFSYTFVYSHLRLYGEEGISHLMNRFAFIGMLVALAGVIQYCFYGLTSYIWFLQDTPYWQSKGQVASMYSNPNIFGVMTSISMGCYAVAMALDKRRLSVRDCVVFLVFIMGVIVSGSRMALLSVVLVLFGVNLWRIFYFRGMIAIVIATLAMATFSFGVVGQYIDLNFRGEIWAASLLVFSDNWLVGVGLGQLQFVLSDYSDLISWVQSANSFYVGWLAETGIFSFAALAIFITCVFFRLSSKNSAVAFVFFLALVSQFSEYFIIYVGSFVILFWTCVAYAVYAGDKARGEAA